MVFSLNSLKGDYMEDYVGVTKGDPIFPISKSSGVILPMDSFSIVTSLMEKSGMTLHTHAGEKG